MDKPLSKNIIAGNGPLDIGAYEKADGYQAVRRALKDMQPGEVTELVKNANLKGRGGAGFNTGMKWGFVPQEKDTPTPRYLVANADEMEPGTFKDRYLLEGDPHQLIEGMIIAAYAIQAEVAYIFIRWAYKKAQRLLAKAISECHQKGLLGKNILGSGFNLEMHIHISAGRYMCGEETGLLNALEGKRATPRAKPPFPQISGLWGKPTIVQNVETLCNLPHIVNNGAEWYHNLSRNKEEGGTKIYGVSGRVKKPGIWELPLGTPIREIIEEHAGGMEKDFALRALLPGGASTDFLLEEHLELLCWMTKPVRSEWCTTWKCFSLRNPADGAHPAGMDYHGSLRFFRGSRAEKAGNQIWIFSHIMQNCWDRVIHFAHWPQGQLNRCKAH
jgi:NADH-quinone oxidoreductase subunit F